MTKILISGFEPFGGNNINSSWQAVKALPDSIKGYEIIKTEIPVVFGKAASELLALAEKCNPNYIFMIGQAGGRACVTPETVAYNLRKGKDNDGCEFDGTPIIFGGEETLCTGLDVAKTVDNMSANGYRIAVSTDAGRYVCNDTFYLALQYCMDKDILCDFVHVPFLPSETQSGQYPAVELEIIVKTLQEYISEVI